MSFLALKVHVLGDFQPWKPRFSLRFISAFAGLCLPTMALAHHGQEFLLLQDANALDPLKGSLFSSYEWSRASNRNGYGVEAGVMLGVAPRVAAGVTVEFSDTGSGWRYDSVAPFLHITFTPPEWRVRMALQAGYSFVDDKEPASAPVVSRSQKKVDSTDKSDPGPATPKPVEPTRPTDPREYNPDDPGSYNPDAPRTGNARPRRTTRHAGHVSAPPPSSASSSSREDATKLEEEDQSDDASSFAASTYRGLYPNQNHWFGRLILEADLTQSDKFLFNLLWVSPDHGPPAWGYAAGWQHRFSHEWAVGLEAVGDFGMEDEHETVMGVYWSPWHQSTLKLGLGCGLTEESPDLSLRVGLVWRF